MSWAVASPAGYALTTTCLGRNLKLLKGLVLVGSGPGPGSTARRCHGDGNDGMDFERLLSHGGK